MSMLKTIALSACFTVAALGVSSPAYATSNSNAHNKVTICHATGSKTNVFVRISPNANGVVAGHAAHQDERDIIPTFHYNDHGSSMTFPGQNWNAQGQAIYNNGCKPVTSTVTPGRGGGVNSSVPISTPVEAATPAEQITAVPKGAVNAGFGSNSSKLAALAGLAGSLSALGIGARLLKR
jgi:hypothetical protein